MNMRLPLALCALFIVVCYANQVNTDGSATSSMLGSLGSRETEIAHGKSPRRRLLQKPTKKPPPPSVSASPPPPAPPPPPALTPGQGCDSPGWVNIWTDEFDSFDTNKWSHQLYDGFQYGISGWGNSEYEWYTNKSANSFISNSNMVLKAQVESDATWMKTDCEAACVEYCAAQGTPTQTCKDNCSVPRCTDIQNRAITSARIRTYKKFSVGPSSTYANIRVEAKVSMPQFAGMFGAIWMLPEDGATDTCSGCGSYGGWPLSGEIDIQESVNNAPTAVGTVHYGGLWPNNVYNGGSTALTSGFNVHAIQWNTTQIRWFLNDAQFHSVTSNQWYTNGAKSSKIAPFDKKFHILMNLAVGGNWPASDYQSTTGNTLTVGVAKQALQTGKELRVDWLRVCGKN